MVSFSTTTECSRTSSFAINNNSGGALLSVNLTKPQIKRNPSDLKAKKENSKMSLLLFSDPFEYSRPSRILNQHFGLGLDPEDLLAPLIPREMRHLMRCPAGYLRPWRSAAQERDTGSTVTFDKDKFQANLDVQQFKPEEITVKVSDNVVTVEGKHEEKEDEHGYISRHFVRRYVLPKGHDVSKIESKLSSDGVLTITAPRTDVDKEQEKSIPVVQTGQPSKAVEQKKEEKKK